MRRSTRLRIEALEARPIYSAIPTTTSATTTNTPSNWIVSSASPSSHDELSRTLDKAHEHHKRDRSSLIEAIAIELSFIGPTDQPVKLTADLLTILLDGKHGGIWRPRLEMNGRPIEIVEPGQPGPTA